MSESKRKSHDITPNSAADLPITISRLYVGAGGDIKLELLDDAGVPVTLFSVPTGTVLELTIKKIYGAPDTTATKLVGFSR